MDTNKKIGICFVLAAFVVCSAGTALADFSGTEGGEDRGIELSGGNGPEHRSFDQLLSLEGMNESVLQRHARSAHPVQAPMGGNYGREGAAAPQLYGSQDLSQFVARRSAPESLSESVAISQVAAVHMVGSGAVSGSAPSVVAAGSGSGTTVVQQNTTQVVAPAPNVPIPPSILLLASGLLGLPMLCRRMDRVC